MNIKQEVKIKIQQMSTDILSNFVCFNRLFVSVYSSQDNNSKRYKPKKYYLPKVTIKSYNVIINGKKSYDQLIDSDI